MKKNIEITIKPIDFPELEKLRSKGVKMIKLNASPYAVDFYHYLGFCDTGEQTSYNGIVYTPMELQLSEE